MRFVIGNREEICLPKKADNPLISEIASNYLFEVKPKFIYSNSENVIFSKNGEEPKEAEGEFVVNITEKGFYIKGKDYSALMRGFLSFLELVKYDEENGGYYAEEGCFEGKGKIGFRCVHLCVFPETDFDFLRKCVRSAAIAKYTHLILEFWGMLKYDTMKELSWSFAYEKSEIKKLVSEANVLGIEVIPMFNHLGHASACRELSGKHVVLDQNPKLEYMFESYGWIWNIEKKEVCELLRKVRKELIEVCGEGKYFHIGCDEVYAYGNNKKKAEKMCEFINETAKELEADGRRPIIWHDMLISKKNFDGYVAMSSEEVEDMFNKKLDRRVVVADWQYDVKNEIWKSSKMLKNSGFDVICCSWDNKDNIIEAEKTAEELKLLGAMQTTWHTLFRGFREMIFAGRVFFGADCREYDDILRFYCAKVARCAYPSKGVYEKSGWTEEMVGPGL